ncbi:hypothetical protein Drorol1_Dr00027380 [Drosera rotundifolia]
MLRSLLTHRSDHRIGQISITCNEFGDGAERRDAAAMERRFRRWVVRTGGAASKGRTAWLDSNGDRMVAFVASRGGVLFSGEFGLFGLVEVRMSGVVHGGVLLPGWLNEGEAAGAGCNARWCFCWGTPAAVVVVLSCGENVILVVVS